MLTDQHQLNEDRIITSHMASGRLANEITEGCGLTHLLNSFKRLPLARLGEISPKFP